VESLGWTSPTEVGTLTPVWGDIDSLTISGTTVTLVATDANFSATYDNVSLPDPYSSAKLFLIGPKLDFTFTDKLYLTTFVRYNNQIDNINMNIRFQWRFAPMSDLFIIYTGNSYAGDYRCHIRPRNA
jgi:hypothetical protein